MHAWLNVVLGQIFIALGAWLLSQHFPWTAVLGLVLIVEGAIGAIYGMLHPSDDADDWRT
jgi:hypothetical protein